MISARMLSPTAYGLEVFPLLRTELEAPATEKGNSYKPHFSHC